MSHEPLRKLIRSFLNEMKVNELTELSDNLLQRLSGFIEEVGRLTYEINSTAGNGAIWSDRKNGGKAIVDSSIDQLLHLADEFDSLVGYLGKRYNDKGIVNVVSALVTTLKSLKQSSSRGMLGGLGKLLQSNDKYVDMLREKSTEIDTRLRACRKAIERLQTKHVAESFGESIH